jgi:hypothetical protein
MGISTYIKIIVPFIFVSAVIYYYFIYNSKSTGKGPDWVNYGYNCGQMGVCTKGNVESPGSFKTLKQCTDFPCLDPGTHTVSANGGAGNATICKGDTCCFTCSLKVKENNCKDGYQPEQQYTDTSQNGSNVHCYFGHCLTGDNCCSAGTTNCCDQATNKGNVKCVPITV